MNKRTQLKYKKTPTLKRLIGRIAKKYCRTTKKPLGKGLTEYPIKIQIAFDPNPTASAWKELHLSFCIYNPNNRLGQPGITGAGSLHLQKKRTEMHKVCRQFQKDFWYQSLEWSLHQVKQSLTNGCQADVNQLF